MRTRSARSGGNIRDVTQGDAPAAASAAASAADAPAATSAAEPDSTSPAHTLGAIMLASGKKRRAKARTGADTETEGAAKEADAAKKAEEEADAAKKAEEEADAAKKAEEEAAKEADAAKPTDEEAAKEADAAKPTDEEAAKEADAAKKAEEEAAKEADAAKKAEEEAAKEADAAKKAEEEAAKEADAAKKAEEEEEAKKALERLLKEDAPAKHKECNEACNSLLLELCKSVGNNSTMDEATKEDIKNVISSIERVEDLINHNNILYGKTNDAIKNFVPSERFSSHRFYTEQVQAIQKYHTGFCDIADEVIETSNATLALIQSKIPPKPGDGQADDKPQIPGSDGDLILPEEPCNPEFHTMLHMNAVLSRRSERFERRFENHTEEMRFLHKTVSLTTREECERFSRHCRIYGKIMIAQQECELIRKKLSVESSRIHGMCIETDDEDMFEDEILSSIEVHDSVKKKLDEFAHVDHDADAFRTTDMSHTPGQFFIIKTFPNWTQEEMTHLFQITATVKYLSRKIASIMPRLPRIMEMRLGAEGYEELENRRKENNFFMLENYRTLDTLLQKGVEFDPESEEYVKEINRRWHDCKKRYDENNEQKMLAERMDNPTTFLKEKDEDALKSALAMYKRSNETEKMGLVLAEINRRKLAARTEAPAPGAGSKASAPGTWTLNMILQRRGPAMLPSVGDNIPTKLKTSIEKRKAPEHPAGLSPPAKCKRLTGRSRVKGALGGNNPGIRKSREDKHYEMQAQILKSQKGIDILIPKSPFGKLVRELARKLFGRGDIRYSKEALLALMEACQDFLLKLFENLNILAYHAKRVTIMKKDLDTARNIRPEDFISVVGDYAATGDDAATGAGAAGDGPATRKRRKLAHPMRRASS